MLYNVIFFSESQQKTNKTFEQTKLFEQSKTKKIKGVDPWIDSCRTVEFSDENI